MNKGRAVVMLSGGVDSAVAAALLKKQGYEMIGVFILGWMGTKNYPCSWQKEEASAAAVAKKLNIPFATINLSGEYYQSVIRPFFEVYQKGETPNPDILCNKEIKFKSLLKELRQFEPDFIATGHYARVKRELPVNSFQFSVLMKGRDENKDQSYFMWGIDREILPKLLLPVGDLTKPQVRKIAQEVGLPNATKKDSQGICFVGPLKVRQFLAENIKTKDGDAIMKDGRIVARHQGVQFYTIGQRLAAGSVSWTGDVPPLFVIAKDVENNRLIVGSDSDCFADKLVADSPNWLADLDKEKFECWAKIRYRQEEVPVEVALTRDQVKVVFKKSVRAITPGQSIVFYQKDGRMLGGAIIRSVSSQQEQITKINARIKKRHDVLIDS